jgi:hypothetical protein
MPDALEVALGLDPTDTVTDDPDYVGVNEVWQCTSMTAQSVTYDAAAGTDEFSFDKDTVFYGTGFVSTGSYATGVECACNNVLVADLDPRSIAGITVWTEQEVHITDIGHADRAFGNKWIALSSMESNRDTAIPAAVAVTPGWSSQITSEYDNTASVAGAIEVGNDSDGDVAWIAFDESTVTPDGAESSTPVSATGSVKLHVSYASAEERPIVECGEFTYVPSASGGDDYGLQFRVDALSMAAMMPAAALPEDDPARCEAGERGQTRFGFIPSPTGGRTPLPLAGSPAYGHASFDRIRIQDWRGAEWLVLTHADGRQVELKPGDNAMLLPPGAPWTLANTTWKMGRDSEGAFSEPVVAVDHTCAGPDVVPFGPVTVEGYTLSYARVDAILAALGAPLTLSSHWPALTDLAQTPLRARIIVPDTWVDGPTQARLRIDIAGGPTVLSLALDPVLDPALRPITPPSMVRDWTIHRTGSGRSIQARLSQTAAGLTVHLDQLTLGRGEALTLESPMTFTLAAE